MTGRSRNHRLRLLGLLGLSGLLGLEIPACGTKVPAVTGLLATITLPAGIKQLQIAVTTKSNDVLVRKDRPMVAGAPLTSPQSVTIYLPDALAGTTVVCIVTALDAGQATGLSGSVEATLVRNSLVPVAIALIPANPVDASTDATGDAKDDGKADLAARDADAERDADKDTGDGAQEVGGPVLRANGQTCTANDECESSLCIDGTCCGSPCSGSCVACNLLGKEGTCSPKPDGTPATCVDQGAPSCGFDGKCDGSGTCRRYEAGANCKAAACAADGSALMPASACDGLGTCTAANAVDCAPYVCDATGGTPACRTTCRAGGADCIAPAVCVNGSCGVTPKKALGAGCVAASDCLSNVCADGVCCSMACTGACISCNQASFLGTCRPVPATKPDPHGVCKDTGVSSCGQSGLCNGAGACALHPVGAVCAAGTCSGRYVRAPKSCDGKGACVAALDRDCLPYRCNPMTTMCFASCTADSQCSATPRRCLGNMCLP